MKHYARLTFDEAEFQLALGSVKASRSTCFQRWVTAKTTANAQEIEFYDRRVAEYDALIARFEAALIADGSQDAEEEDEDENDD